LYHTEIVKLLDIKYNSVKGYLIKWRKSHIFCEYVKVRNTRNRLEYTSIFPKDTNIPEMYKKITSTIDKKIKFKKQSSFDSLR